MTGLNGHASASLCLAAYVARAVEEECAKVANAPPRRAIVTLFRASFSLGTLEGAGVLNRGEAETALLAAALERGKDPREALDNIKRGLDQGRANPRDLRDIRVGSARAKAAGDQARPRPSTRDRGVELWAGGCHISGTPAEPYFAGRHISSPLPASLRYAAGVRMPDGSTHHAMLALVTEPMSGAVLGVQRTAIQADGSGRISIDKASLGSTAGGVVVLADLDGEGPILEGEGVETTLSASQATGLPGVATLSSGTLGKPQLPPGRAVIILADRGSEEDARKGALRRLKEGREVRIAVPPDDGGKDFNDTLRTLGAAAVSAAIDRAAPFSVEAKAPGYVAHILADTKPEPVRWLWKDRIARGKLNLIAGQPGRGKSQMTLFIAALVSAGGSWPDGAPCEPGAVILVSCEDDRADTIVPRLIAARADLSVCRMLEGTRRDDGTTQVFDLASGLGALEQLTQDIAPVALIVIDPISAYLKGLDSHNNAHVRGALLPLQMLAERTGAAVLVVSHLNKGAGDLSAMARVSGSGAFVAACRSAWLVERDPCDDENRRRIVAPLKNNIGDDRTGFVFEIEPVELDKGITTSRVRFLPGRVTIPADELIRTAGSAAPSSRERAEAKAFLAEFLADGPHPHAAIKKAAREAGHSWRTVERAKKELGARSKKSPENGWQWHLPDAETRDLFDKEGRQQRQGRHVPDGGGDGGLAEAIDAAPAEQHRQSSDPVCPGGIGGLGGLAGHGCCGQREAEAQEF